MKENIFMFGDYMKMFQILFLQEQFYSTQEFCRYNMFNHHFFHGSAAQSTFCDFLTGELCERMVVVTDPPFGGLIEVLAETLKVIMKQWKDRNQGISYVCIYHIYIFIMEYIGHQSHDNTPI